MMSSWRRRPKSVPRHCRGPHSSDCSLHSSRRVSRGDRARNYSVHRFHTLPAINCQRHARANTT